MTFPVVLISGYLGGGKTTFLRHLLPVCGKIGMRPALIINEAGNVNIDGKLLEDLCTEQISIIDGCICCSKQAEIDQTVHDVVERGMGDIILIECSGFSSPQAVLKNLSSSINQGIIEIRHVIGIVDSFRCQRIPVLVDLFKEQIVTADIIILNKWGSLTNDQQQIVNQRIIDIVNPAANIFHVNYGEIGENACLDILMNTNTYDEKNVAHHFHHSHDFSTITVNFPNVTTRKILNEFIEKMPDSIIRAKGFVNLDEGWHSVQCVFNSIDITPFTGNAIGLTSSIVCIGYKIDNDTIPILKIYDEK
jgi:G3E family GTPase